MDRDVLFMKWGGENRVLDHGFVRLVDVMGGDASVAEAARVTVGSRSKKGVGKLLNSLMKRGHTSPFEFAEIVLHVKMPIFVARQWVRHRTASINEVSGRYTELPGEMFRVSAWRVPMSRERQASQDGAVAWPEDCRLPASVRDGVSPGAYLASQSAALQDTSRQVYEERLRFGVARELARTDLPLSQYTEWYWKIDLHNLLHFLQLRLDWHAQAEIRAYAEVIALMVRDWVPKTWGAFEEHRLHAVTLSRTEVRRLVDVLRAETTPDGARVLVKDLLDRLEREL